MAYRVLVFVSPENIDAVLESDIDGVVVDLADEKTDVVTTRAWFTSILPRCRESGPKVVVRVNHPRTGLLRGDLDAIVQPGLDAVILPHATEPQYVRELAVLLREFELPREIEPGDVGVFPAVDTARGLLRAPELGTAAPRVAGLVFDSSRYAADAGARGEEWGPRLAYARGACIAAARAADGLPIVAAEGFECRQLAQWGFAGIVLPSHLHVRAARAAFRPSAGELERARNVLAAHAAARLEGARVARLSGAVVDSSEARRAEQTLDGSSGSDTT